jgi:fumarate reductase subunit C
MFSDSLRIKANCAYLCKLVEANGKKRSARAYMLRTKVAVPAVDETLHLLRVCCVAASGDNKVRTKVEWEGMPEQ